MTFTSTHRTATAEVVRLLGDDRFPLCMSPSLRLEKLVRLGRNLSSDKRDLKKDEIDEVAKCHGKHAARIPAFDPPAAETLVATLGGRLIVNQAGGVLENAGLCLHRHFGDPYLPGSAVKGIARHAAWCKWDEAEEPAKRDIAEKVVRVFGYPTGDDRLDACIEPDKKKRVARAGGVAFLAGLPVGKPSLVVEIVNCHHPKYYASKQEVATDDESPNPQFFPAVEAGGEWRFTLVPLRRLGPDSATLLAQAKAWLAEALTLHGAGAKTAAGYGWFSYDAEEESRRKQQEERSAREAALRAEFDVWKANVVDALEDSEPLRATFDRVTEEWEVFKRRFADTGTSIPARQTAEDALNRYAKKLPQSSPEDTIRERWSKAGVKAVINSELKRFATEKDESRKKAMVIVLRDSDGIGSEVWAELKRQGTKGDLAKAVDAIRACCKNVLNLGKMPS